MQRKRSWRIPKVFRQCVLESINKLYNTIIQFSVIFDNLIFVLFNQL